MADLCCPGTGHQLMMHSLIQITLGKFFLRSIDSAAHERRFQNGIDLIKCQPVFYFILIVVKHCRNVAFVKADQITVYPAIVMLCQIQRSLIMGQGYQWLNAIFSALIKQIIVEFKSCLVRCLLISLRENPAPCDGNTENLKAHLSKQLDIFFIMMVKINSYQLHIIFCRLFCSRTFDSMRKNILDGKTFPILVICTFALIGSYRATP